MKLSDYMRVTHFHNKPPFTYGKFRLDSYQPSKSLEYPFSATIVVVRENSWTDYNSAGKEVTIYGESTDIEYVTITGP
jgi:hypothetical protein